MNRISREQMFLAMARAASMRSTCYRLAVGAVLVRDSNVVSVGYNGAPSGQPHCTGLGCEYYADAGCTVRHAERNAVERWSPTHQWSEELLEMYCTHSPCSACAALMVKVGVKKFFYETAYRDSTPIELLEGGGVVTFRVLPSGFFVDTRGRMVSFR